MQLSLGLEEKFKITYILHALAGSFIPDADKLSNQKRGSVRSEYRPIFDRCRAVIAEARELEETLLKEFQSKKFKRLSDKIRASSDFLDAVHDNTIQFVCESLEINPESLRLVVNEVAMYHAQSEKYKAQAERCGGKAGDYTVSSARQNAKPSNSNDLLTF